MSTIAWAIIAAVWLLGAVATNAAHRVMGEASANTIGDSFSGDDTVDLALVVLWPVFWPCWAVHTMVERGMRQTKPSPRGPPT